MPLFSPVDLDTRAHDIMAERHARPPLPVGTPALCQQMIFRRQDVNSAFCTEGWRAFFDRAGLDAPLISAESVFAESDALSMKWEHHTEFVSLTTVHRVTGADANAITEAPPLDSGAPVFHAVVIGVELSTQPRLSESPLFAWADTAAVRTSQVLDGSATIASDFAFDANGCVRILVSAEQDDPHRLGRLVQRLIEIESYSTLSLLAWDTVTATGPLLQKVDDDLKALVTQIPDSDRMSDQAVLSQLEHLAAIHETNVADANFRLSASLAYFDIVEDRLVELNETVLTGSQSFRNFIRRRGVPAAKTYTHILNRQEKISERLNRATQLLRSRVDVALASQNQLQLEAMNKRAEAQYRLQKTVEGLSAIAISYYALGLLSYLATSIDVSLAEPVLKANIGYLTPLVVVVVWLGLRRLH
ncbi:MAG: DUF3422 domain-containing protein [Pseudomonadota bacterium]